MNNIKVADNFSFKTGARWLRIGLVLMFTFAFFGCEQEGPVEQAGEKVDEAVSDTQRAVEDAVD